MKVTLKIRRFNPEKDHAPWWGHYEVECEPTDRVLDALNQVKWYQDGSLTYRRSCAHGICGSDAMRINGRNRLACKTLIQELRSPITIEPLLGLPVIKDLVVDMTPFMEHYRSILPYLLNEDPPPADERLQSATQRERFDDTTKCILCAACTTACPIFWARPDYVGPAAIVQAHRFIFDSRDQAAEERLRILDSSSGVWRCRGIYNCTEACPRAIQVTQAIAEIKREILRRRR
ncbi:MAG: succinate dehydrogenase iron-sulfur subunit [Anaerolineae bacterium]|nr:succinate dehydrogenase iron-sulfur subunit [Anaerolineae bacterium]MDW8070949.1 succinate dehydrogenase iron-sulfur subunit [Anaerolineae bacterium]